jgi:hypothetical protein
MSDVSPVFRNMSLEGFLIVWVIIGKKKKQMQIKSIVLTHTFSNKSAKSSRSHVAYIYKNLMITM